MSMDTYYATSLVAKMPKIKPKSVINAQQCIYLFSPQSKNMCKMPIFNDLTYLN